MRTIIEKGGKGEKDQVVIEIAAFPFKLAKPMKSNVSTRSLIFGDHNRTFLEFWREKEGTNRTGTRQRREAETKDREESHMRKKERGKQRREEDLLLLGGARVYGQSYTARHKNSAPTLKNNDTP